MCGIAGIISPEKIPFRVLKRMTDLVEHRGPDDHGYLCYDYESGEVSSEKEFPGEMPFHLGLGHRRLSILDPSARGWQPMAARQGRYWIVFNGAIYNYVELKANLLARGHSFRSQTDTEVALKAYQEYGADCFQLFNGMWAIAILDLEEKRIVVSRDRFGIKPIYYYLDNRTVLFSSELKQITSYPYADCSHDDDRIEHYLKTGEIENRDGRTFYGKIRSLPPAHYMMISFREGLEITEPNKFYQVANDSAVAGQTEKAAAERLRDLLADAVSIRLRSDAATGIFISGGLDSTTIGALAADKLIRKQGACKGINFYSEQDGYDELNNLTKLTTEKGISLERVTYDYEELRVLFPRLMRHQELPFFNPSVFAQWVACRKAKESGLKVMLSGQGGDEIFGGYHPYFYRCGLELLRRRRYRDFLIEAWLYLRHQHRYDLLARTVRRQFATPGDRREPARAVASRLSCGFTEACFRRIESGNLEMLLRFEDRNSMAHSIETRFPFLDYRVVDFVISLDMDLKMKNGYSKYLLRRATEELLPKSIREERKKAGFYFPMSRFIRFLLSENDRLAAQVKGLGRLNSRTEELYWRHICLAQWNEGCNG